MPARRAGGPRIQLSGAQRTLRAAGDQQRVRYLSSDHPTGATVAITAHAGISPPTFAQRVTGHDRAVWRRFHSTGSAAAGFARFAALKGDTIIL